MCHAVAWSLEISNGMYQRPSSLAMASLVRRTCVDLDDKKLTFDRMSCKKLPLKYQMSRACKFRTRWTLGAPSSMALLFKSPKKLKKVQMKA